MTQTELGDLLGVTKQAVSKIEQTEKFDDTRLAEIAKVLGVTVEGLKKYNEEMILINTNNFHENCGVKTSTGNIHTFNNISIDEIVKLFEDLLQKEREKFEYLRKKSD